MYRTISTDQPEKDVYEHLVQTMTKEEIKEWMEGMVRVCTAHMSACADKPGDIDEIDESFLMYENAFLYLLGLAKTNGLFNEDLH